MKRGRGCSAGRREKGIHGAQVLYVNRLSLIGLENGKQGLKAEQQQIIQ